MAAISGLNIAIRQPYPRVTGTSYPSAYASSTEINNTPANFLAALPRLRIVGDTVRMVSSPTSSNGPIGVTAALDGSTSLTDTPYDLEGTDIALKLVASAAAVPLNDLRVLNDGSFEVDAFYKTFLADAIRARIEQLLIVGDETTTPAEFDGLENFTGMQTHGSTNTNASTRMNSIEIMADLCMRGRGIVRCDALVMTTAARRKLRSDCRDTNTEWRESGNYAMVNLAQGWTQVIVNDFISGADASTSIFGLVLKGENACSWAVGRGMENVKFSAVRSTQQAQNWIVGEALGALAIQDNTKVAQLTGYDAS